jgi:uncharacterized delta-60 repeat protein
MSNTRSGFARTAIAGALFAAAATTFPAEAAPLPPTSPGAFDPTFNGGASLVQPLFTRDDFAMAVHMQADGKSVMAGYGRELTSSMGIGYVARFTADGSPDATFGNAGVVRFGDAATGKPVLDMIGAADGKVLVGGDVLTGADPDMISKPWLARINADGSPDLSFGNGGEVVAGCAPRTECYIQKLARQADGKIVALLGAYQASYSEYVAFVDRFNADGSPDATFGTSGRVVLDQGLQGLEPYHIAIDGQGRYVVSGVMNDNATKLDIGVIARITSDGKLDPSFNGSGVVRMAIDGLATDFRGFDFQADGKIVLAGTAQNPALAKGERSQVSVLRLNANGTIDMAFGMARLGAGYGNGVKVQADGAIVFYGEGLNAATASKAFVPMAARVLPNGQIDASFGPGGKVLTAPQSPFSTLTSVAIGADNRMTFSGYLQPSGGQYRHSALTQLIGTETTTSVIEYYNTGLNHYFVTADPNEASAIDAGAAGPGWQRTGAAWKSGGPLRVCRFYGSPEVSPKTGSRSGPNGHFYTISADECALVKEDAGWKFESYDFSGWPKQADGSCAAGTIAVKRVYNNRFALNDSNHRYMTSDALYTQMVASGWSGEGTVFCVPQ